VKPVEIVKPKIEPATVLGEFWDIPEVSKPEEKKPWSNVEIENKKSSIRDIQKEEIDANKNKPKPEKPKLVPDEPKEVLWTSTAKSKPKSLREIQEEELKRQQREKEILEEEKRTQTKNTKPATTTWTSVWNNNESKKQTIREIQEQELKQKDTNEEDPRKYVVKDAWDYSTYQKSTSLSIKDIQKEELNKSKPSTHIPELKETLKEPQQAKKTPLAPNPWGASASSTPVKPLREIQAEESVQKATPPTVVPSKSAPTKEDSFFWDVPENEESKTKTRKSSLDSDFPTLSSASKKQGAPKQAPPKQYAQALLQTTTPPPITSPKQPKTTHPAKTDTKTSTTPSKKKAKMSKIKPELLGFTNSSGGALYADE